MIIRTLFLIFTSALIPINHPSEVNKFDQLLEDFYQDGLELNPFVASVFNSDTRNPEGFEITISDDYRAEFESYYKKYETALSKFNREDLTSEQKTSFDILIWECKINIESNNYPDHLTPINQFWCLPFTVNQQAGGTGAIPFKTIEDYENWLKRLDQFILWCDLAISRMKEGIEANYVLPKVLTEKMIPQYTALASGLAKDHFFFGPIKNLPEDLSPESKERISDLYEKMIAEKIIPAFSRLLNFLQDEYLLNARDSHGLSDLPGGAAYYNYLIKVQTTSEFTADEIHDIGLSEVARIRGNMKEIMKQVEFDGTLLDFFEHVKNNPKLMPFDSPDQVLRNFEAIHTRIQPRLKELFDIDINIPFEIKRVPKYLEATASPYYTPGAADGSRPGTFFVPVPEATKYNTYTDESLFLHEAIPGHHFQTSVAVEMPNSPEFRKYLWYGAYGEGWGLYSESLGKELGLFQDPYQEFGMLSLEMHRAIRLVVDTGIHAKKWTREQAIEYSLQNEALSLQVITSEVERYMAWPAQALSYKIGQLKIQKLRLQAEEELGSKFDPKEFHNQVLGSGAVPLTILEERIDSYIKSNK